MSQLIIFENLEDTCNFPAERGLRIAWDAQLPKLGDCVSMGQGCRWHVNGINRYASANSQVEAIYLVRVGLERRAPDLDRDERPYIGFGEVGSPEWLMMGYLVDPDADYPTGQIISYIPVSEHDVRREPQPWQVEGVEVFVKIDKHAPYQSFAICWCAAIPERELVAA